MTTSITDIEAAVWNAVQNKGSADTEDLLPTIKAPEDCKDLNELLNNVVKSLSARDIIVSKAKPVETLVPNKAGKSIVDAQISPEFKFFSDIPAEGIAVKDANALPSFKLGVGPAKMMKMVQTGKNSEGIPVITRKDNVTDTVFAALSALPSNPSTDMVKILKKRKLVTINKTIYYTIKKGERFGTAPPRPMTTDFTQDMLVSGEWRDTEFKPIKWDALGKKSAAGATHPLMDNRARFRDIFVSMGFQEMCTDKWVESSFWNFDTLFQPQQHPARDVQDTFFCDGAAGCAEGLPEDYLKRVRTVHQEGGHGSIGWRYEFSEDETKRNILRTHTTAVTSRLLSKLVAKYEETGNIEDMMGRFFSIDRVFRNETLDATHLAEFQQIEGVVIGKDLDLGHLKAFIREFFKQLGMTEIRFKPTFNPYTEPSAEIFAKHPGLGNKWLELGNSGVFRPEMLLPKGLPEDMTVIAWGLSLERPTMITTSNNNIRSLVGHKTSLTDVVVERQGMSVVAHKQ